MLRKELPCYQKDGKKLEILPKHLRILVQQSRLLAVRLTASGLRKTLAVARAPRSRSSVEARAIWRERKSKCTRTYGIDRLMIDANGTTGHNASRNIGDYGD